MQHLGDVTKIKGNEVPIVDCVIGGSPCQDLSVAGKRAGLEGERSGLFIEQIRIIKELRDADRRKRNLGRTDINVRPRFGIWENVPGAFSSNKGEDFRIVLEEFCKVADCEVSIPEPDKGKWATSGCIVGEHFSLAWRVLDAQWWGVPQRRRRITLVADFNGHQAPFVLFNRCERNGETERSTGESPLRDLGEDSKSQVQPLSESMSRDLEQGEQERKEAADDASKGSRTGNPAYTMQIRCGCEGGGKGALIQTDKSATLSTSNIQTLFQPVGCNWDGSQISPTLTANNADGSQRMPDKENFNCVLAVDMGGGKSNVGVSVGTTPTLTTTHGGEPCVVYDARGNGDGLTVPTITGDHENRVTDYTGLLVLENTQEHGTIRDDGIVPTLVARMGTGGNNVPMICKEKPLGLAMQTSQGALASEDLMPALVNGDNPGWQNGVCHKADNDVEYIDGWDGNMEKVFTDDKMNTVRAAQPQVVFQSNEISYIVRRLTPTECERLQGYPDGWTDIGEYINSKGRRVKTADSARYKALGNSIALPSWKWVVKRISAVYERDATMASLFDGIGGFPYLWEQINGKGSCLWASEIEDFPMAVTMKRI